MTSLVFSDTTRSGSYAKLYATARWLWRRNEKRAGSTFVHGENSRARSRGVSCRCAVDST